MYKTSSFWICARRHEQMGGGENCRAQARGESPWLFAGHSLPPVHQFECLDGCATARQNANGCSAAAVHLLVLKRFHLVNGNLPVRVDEELHIGRWYLGDVVDSCTKVMNRVFLWVDPQEDGGLLPLDSHVVSRLSCICRVRVRHKIGHCERRRGAGRHEEQLARPHQPPRQRKKEK